jgi:hypothetical protein
MASGAAAAALAVAVMAVTREPAEPCAAPSARVDLVWGAARRSAIEHHLMACAPSLGDKRFAVVAKTIKGIASVGPLERCADATALQVAARPPIEPAEAADVQAIATEVQAIAIALRRGAVAGLNAPADAVIDRARVLAHAPPLVAALAARVNVAQVQQDVPHAIAFLRELALGDVGRIERAILLADVGLVDVGHLLFDTPGAKVDVPDRRDASVEPSPGDGNGERERIVRALDTCAGNPTRAARMLAMSRTTLVQRLQLYGIPRPQTPQ